MSIFALSGLFLSYHVCLKLTGWYKGLLDRRSHMWDKLWFVFMGKENAGSVEAQQHLDQQLKASNPRDRQWIIRQVFKQEDSQTSTRSVQSKIRPAETRTDRFKRVRLNQDKVGHRDLESAVKSVLIQPLRENMIDASIESFPDPQPGKPYTTPRRGSASWQRPCDVWGVVSFI